MNVGTYCILDTVGNVIINNSKFKGWMYYESF